MEMQKREQEIYDLYYNKLAIKTDRIFAVLFIFQWILGIIFAFLISPKAWAGVNSQVHIHVYAAIFLGGIAAAFPIYLTLKHPGHHFNRYVVATTQIFYSILLIHLTGGRIETHFHIFVSLAFLAFYRDYKPVLLATIITAADHLLRGIYWPESVYGVLSASPLRALEHSAWVLFENVILYFYIKNGIDELKTISGHQVTIENTLADVENLVEKRTAELRESQKHIIEQQQTLVYSSKMSALGEMASGVAHEINTPLTIISMRVEKMEHMILAGELEQAQLTENLKLIKKTTDRIAKIIRGLSFFARDGKKNQPQSTKVTSIIEETLSFCNERFKHHAVKLEVENESDESLELVCRAVEVSQVLLNLLNNAHDAIGEMDEKWIKIHIKDLGTTVEISITDSGNGIPKHIQNKIMQPFFTTKEVGKGTGLGLSISKGIIEEHKGKFYIDNNSSKTKFVIQLPKIG